jgi:acetyl esterase/lipase
MFIPLRQDPISLENCRNAPLKLANTREEFFADSNGVVVMEDSAGNF